jgi:hypothetical protein
MRAASKDFGPHGSSHLISLRIDPFRFLDRDAVSSEKVVEVGLILAVLATLSAGLFAGAAVYVTLVEHPARVSCGVELAVTEFRPSYKRATVMQASLALVGTIAGIGRWGVGGGLGWLVAAGLLGAVVPFTLFVILPTNDRLLDDSLDKTSPDVESLLARWGRLHAMRSVLSLLAFVVFLVLLANGCTPSFATLTAACIVHRALAR